jgi:hypothetical protein
MLTTENNNNYRVTTGLATGSQYDFIVRAKNVVDTSVDSLSARLMAARVPGAPAAPVKISADSV